MVCYVVRREGSVIGIDKMESYLFSSFISLVEAANKRDLRPSEAHATESHSFLDCSCVLDIIETKTWWLKVAALRY